MEKNETLYCYKLVENGSENCILKQIKIDQWKLDPSPYRGDRFSFNGVAFNVSSYHHDNISKDKLDRLIYNKLFTFNPDPNHAKKIIIEDITHRKAKAECELQKWSAKLNMWTQLLENCDIIKEG